MAGLDLLAEDFGDDEGAISGDRRGPSQYRSGLFLLKDVRNAAKGGSIAKAGSDEEDHEENEERPPVGLGGLTAAGLHDEIGHPQGRSHLHDGAPGGYS